MGLSSPSPASAASDSSNAAGDATLTHQPSPRLEERLEKDELVDMKEQVIQEQAAKGAQPGLSIVKDRQLHGEVDSRQNQWGNVPNEVYDAGAAQSSFATPEEDASSKLNSLPHGTPGGNVNPHHPHT